MHTSIRTQTMDEIRGVLGKRLVRIGSPWFPTPREQREWDASSAPLYWRHISDQQIDIGPRFFSIRASCFSPIDRLQFERTETGIHIHRRRRFLPITTGLILLWAVLLTGWLIAYALQLSPESSNPGNVLFVLFLGGVTGLGLFLGIRQGTAELNANWDWFRNLLDEDVVEGEDWGPES